MRHRCQRPSVVVKRLARRFAFGRYWVQTPVPPDLVLWVFFKSFPHTHLEMSTQATPGSVYSPLSTYHPPHRTHPVSVAEKALESPPSGEKKDASFPVPMDADPRPPIQILTAINVASLSDIFLCFCRRKITRGNCNRKCTFRSGGAFQFQLGRVVFMNVKEISLLQFFL
jgi:hypothetical protein